MTIHGALSGRTLFAPWETLPVTQEVVKGKRSGRSQGKEERHSQMVYRRGYYRGGGIGMLLGAYTGRADESQSGTPAFGGTWLLSWQSPDVGGIAETDTSGQPNTIASYSSLYSVSSGVSQAHLQSLSWHVAETDSWFHHRLFVVV